MKRRNEKEEEEEYIHIYVYVYLAHVYVFPYSMHDGDASDGIFKTPISNVPCRLSETTHRNTYSFRCLARSSINDDRTRARDLSIYTRNHSIQISLAFLTQIEKKTTWTCATNNQH